MKIRQWIILAVATITSSLLVRVDSQSSAAQKDSLPETAQEQQNLNQAIQNLSSPDQLVRRNAGREIAKLSSTPGIQRAINPLIAAATDLRQVDGIVNRSIYIGALGSICRQVGPPANNNTVDFLADVLLADPSDFMRIASARAIGLCKNDLAIAPLEYAIANDPAPFVVMQADVSLKRLQRELGITSGGSAPTLLSESAALSPDSPVSQEELEKYIKTRFIVFGK